MILSVLLGVVFGLIGLVPLYVSTRLVKRITATNTYGFLGAFLAAILVSMVILVVSMIVCKVVAPDVVKAFCIAEVLVFVVGVIVVGLVRMIRSK